MNNRLIFHSHFSDPLELSDFSVKSFNISTLKVGGLVSVHDFRKQPKEDHLVVFSSYHVSDPQSVERPCFAIVRHATCKDVKDSVKQIEEQGEYQNK